MTGKSRYFYTFLTLVCLGLLVVATFYLPSLIKKPKYDIHYIQDWTETPDGTESFSLPHAIKWDENGEYRMYTTLPELKESTDNICFWSYLSSVEVFLENELIYYYHNVGTGSFGMASTSNWNLFELPKNASGKQLTVLLKTPYTDTEPRINAVVCGDVHDLHHWLSQKYYTYRFSEDLMFWFGLLLIVAGLILGIKTSRYNGHIWGGVLLVLFGIYTRTATQSLPLENLTPYAIGFLCYFSLFTIPIPLTLYTRAKVKSSKIKTFTCEILTYAELFVAVTAFSLHRFGKVDIHYSMPYAMVLLLVSLICTISFAINHYLKKRTKGALSAVLYSFLVLIILVTEYTQFYFLNFLPFKTGVISRIGAMGILVVEGYLLILDIFNDIKEKEKIKGEHKNLQLQMLTDNIRPHFILNTIGAIRTLIPSEPKRASDLLLDFSKYVRKNMEQKDYYTPIPFLEELDYIQTYVSLEKARFGDTITVHYNCQDNQFRILPLTVQPFVENAIKHGLFSTDNGKLWISTIPVEGGHMIEIIDNGVGFDTTHLEEFMQNKKAVGMRSAVIRLETLMNANVSIHSNVDTGTCVQIVIPESR